MDFTKGEEIRKYEVFLRKDDLRVSGEVSFYWTHSYNHEVYGQQKAGIDSLQTDSTVLAKWNVESYVDSAIELTDAERKEVDTQIESFVLDEIFILDKARLEGNNYKKSRKRSRQ